MSGRHPLRTRGFTLIELLVVVSIIAVLSALLLPAIKIVRGSALVASCSQKLRMIAAAAESYSSDFDGMALPFVASNVFWHVQLDPYLEQATMTSQVKNTTADQTTIAMKWAFACPAWPRSYQMVCAQLGSAYYYNMGSAAPGYGWGTWAYLTSLGPNRGPGTFTAMYNPNWWAIPRAQIKRQAERPMCSDAPQYWFDSTSGVTSAAAVDARHRHPGGMVTTAFWDGHVAQQTLQQRVAGMLLTQ
jgi:prepilin-type N-terminal cleavage/methylation domain-containing protein/prepilin-type processing-associated H-X9-DG protein